MCRQKGESEKAILEEELLFGKYRILRILANGSGGEVFLAEHDALDEKRVIKCLYKNKPFYEERRKEANILKLLHHAAIPTIYDIEEDEAATYIIEAYVGGESLNEVLFRQKSLPVSFILFYSIQLCEIIEYLHKEGILYLDIKPENLMVCGDKLSLIDFGGAIHKEEPLSVSFGTQGFAAPEQYRGEVQERTDVYGIGRVMGVMLGDGTGRETKQQKELQKIYRRCTQAIPAKRYRSVAGLKEELCRLYYQKPEKKRKRPGPCVIGVAGAHEGAEAAAVCAAAAGYFGERGEERVVSIDLSGQGIFGTLYESLHGRNRTALEEFGICGVTYRTGMAAGGMERIFAEGFSVILLYFGTLSDTGLGEFCRCDCRLLVGETYPWRLRDWYRLEEKLKNFLAGERVTVLVSGGDKDELPLCFRSVRELPRLRDILHPDRKTEQFFKNIFN